MTDVQTLKTHPSNSFLFENASFEKNKSKQNENEDMEMLFWDGANFLNFT